MKDHPSQWITSGLTCRDVAERITDYLDERLSILTKIRVGLHLASCADCRTYMRQIALVRDATTLLPKQFPSPIARLRLHQHFAARHAHQTGC
jgi:predicted anti-sigma-YlaC factor YlaD